LHCGSFSQLTASKNDSNVGPVLEYPSAQADAVHLSRHTNITENKIHYAARFLQDCYCIDCTFRLSHIKAALFKMESETKADYRLIFDNQYDLLLGRSPTLNDFGHGYRPLSRAGSDVGDGEGCSASSAMRLCPGVRFSELKIA